MKKLLLIALLATFTLGLSSCVTTPDPDPDPECTGEQVLVDGVCEDPTPDPDTTAPVLTGVVDATIFLDSTFDPLTGVTSVDAVDGDITTAIVVQGTVDTSVEGDTYLLYTSTDAAGNATQGSRTITVEVDPSTIGDELIPNGDFDMGTALWNFDGGGVEGGLGSYAVTDGVMAVTIGTAGWGGWEPRLRNEGLTFDNGVTYEITFKAKADAARSIKVDAAELLTAAPWTIQFAPTEVFDLTTEWVTYSFKVTMTKDSNTNGSLLFQHGEFDGGVEGGTWNTVVYYDDIMMEVSTPDADTTEPAINGIDDVTVMQGGTFDPLDGVTAIDNLDGDMTLVLADVAGLDTLDLLMVGEYTITYSLTDAAGNVASEDRVVTVVALDFIDAMQIVDGMFDATTTIPDEVQDADNGYADITAEDIWYNYVAGWDGAAATFAVTDGAAVIDVTAPGNNNWGVMLKQKGLDLMNGEIYRLTFTASATVDRDMAVQVTGDSFEKLVNLTATPTEYEYIFVYDGDDVTAERVIFLLGNTAAYAAGVVTLDNVLLEVAGEEPLDFLFMDDMQVVDGMFDATTTIIDEVQDADNGYADITAEDVWYNYVAGWDGAAATFAVTDGAAVIDVTAPGNNDWGVMLKQKGIELVSGVAYKLMFTASATADRDITAKVTDNYFDSFDLTATPTMFEFEFVYMGDDAMGQNIIFTLGATEAYAAGVVTIDDVMLEIGIDPEMVLYEDDMQVVDGMFDTTTTIIDEVQDADNGYADITAEDVWYNYVAGWDGAAATFAVTDGAAVIDVTAPGNNDWGVMLKQKGIDLVYGTMYQLSFTASATADRDVTAKVTDFYYESFDLTATPTMFSFYFLYLGDDAMGQNIIFTLGATEAYAAGVVTIDDVMLEVGTNPQLLTYADAMQVVDGMFDTTTTIIDEVQDADNGYADITAEDVWYNYVAGWDGAAATFAVTDGAAVVDVTAPGNNDWGVMLKQKGVDLVEGNVYKLSFTASATVDRDVTAKVTDFYYDSFDLTATPTEFSFYFLYTDADATAQNIIFTLGATEAFAAGVVTIDNVKLEMGS